MSMYFRKLLKILEFVFCVTPDKLSLIALNHKFRESFETFRVRGQSSNGSNFLNSINFIILNFKINYRQNVERSII